MKSEITTNTLVIGVDGGGSRTRARLANARGDTLGNGEAGPANPHAKGFQAAEREIRIAVESAFSDARVERQTVGAVCLGISGVDRPEERTRFIAWARETIAPHVLVVNDGEIVLAAGSPENWGVALIAGTGSIAWGKTRDGRIARAGGWGYMIGDEGSGFDLAREAIAPHVLVVNDGEIVLAAGSSENWGVALIAGTGSIAWGKTRDGHIARAGG